MTNHICSLCNTELVENLISCSGRCNKFFHYTCVGLTRSSFDVYKKVEGLKWQCTECTNDLKGIWKKLDELTTMVNDLKTTVSLGGLVKSVISEAIRSNGVACSTGQSNLSSTNRQVHGVGNSTKKQKQRRNKRKKNGAVSSTPVNGNTMQATIIESTINPDNVTIIPSSGYVVGSSNVIRTAESRTYG